MIRDMTAILYPVAANGELAMNRGNSDTATLSINGTATRLSDGQKLATYGNYL